MIVKEILATKKDSGTPLGVTVDDKVDVALKIMVKHDTGSCVVTNKDGKLVGMLTFRELLKKLSEDQKGCLDCLVKEIMNPDPPIATPDDSVDQIRNLMTSEHVRYLPVMTDGKLTDVISFYDVARAVASESDFENRMLKQYINEWPADN